jgi:hypothetical protein
MSQAHYVRCSVKPCANEAIARLTFFRRYAARPINACKEHLDRMLTLMDEGAWGEALTLTWVWDAGTRECVLHQWPAVLCEGWSEEHRALRRRGLFASSDVPDGQRSA